MTTLRPWPRANAEPSASAAALLAPYGLTGAMRVSSVAGVPSTSRPYTSDELTSRIGPAKRCVRAASSSASVPSALASNVPRGSSN